MASINNVPGSEDNMKVLLNAVQHNAETAFKTNVDIIMISGKVITDPMEHTTPVSICKILQNVHGVLKAEQLNNKYLKGVYDLDKVAGFSTDAGYSATLVTGDKSGMSIRMLMAVVHPVTDGKMAYVVNKKVSHFLNDSGLATKVSPLKKADMVTLARAMLGNADKTIEFMNKLSARAKQLSHATLNLDKKAKLEMTPEEIAKFQEIASIVQGLLRAVS